MTQRDIDPVAASGEEQFRAWSRRRLPPVEQLRPTLWSIPVPMPAEVSPPYVYSYVFAVRDRLFVVDPGWPSDEAWGGFCDGMAEAGLDPGAVEGIAVTHAHPDHVGLASRLALVSGAWLGMHPAEAASLTGDGRGGPGRTARWLRERGGPPDEAASIAHGLGDVTRLARATPRPDRLIEDGSEPFGPGSGVHAVWTPGHTAGHLCFRHDDYGVLLTGDHVLPHISPNVSVHVDDRRDALGEYLQSLDIVAAHDDAEILPGHEYRFRGIETRARDLADHHADRLGEIRTVLAGAGSRTTWQVAAELTWSRGWDATAGTARLSAVAETYAHLIHLERHGEIRLAGDAPTDAWTAAD